METWGHGDTGMRTWGHRDMGMGTQGHGDMGMGTWRYRAMGTWGHGHGDVGAQGWDGGTEEEDRSWGWSERGTGTPGPHRGTCGTRGDVGGGRGSAGQARQDQVPLCHPARGWHCVLPGPRLLIKARSPSIKQQLITGRWVAGRRAGGSGGGRGTPRGVPECPLPGAGQRPLRPAERRLASCLQADG